MSYAALLLTFKWVLRLILRVGDTFRASWDRARGLVLVFLPVELELARAGPDLADATDAADEEELCRDMAANGDTADAADSADAAGE